MTNTHSGPITMGIQYWSCRWNLYRNSFGMLLNSGSNIQKIHQNKPKPTIAAHKVRKHMPQFHWYNLAGCWALSVKKQLNLAVGLVLRCQLRKRISSSGGGTYFNVDEFSSEQEKPGDKVAGNWTICVFLYSIYILAALSDFNGNHIVSIGDQ